MSAVSTCDAKLVLGCVREHQIIVCTLAGRDTLSTETKVVRANLQRLDREVKCEERKLGFFRRFARRYFGWRTAVVAKIASTFGICKGIALSYAVAGKAVLTGLAIKMPAIAVVAEWVAGLTEGAVHIASNTS